MGNAGVFLRFMGCWREEEVLGASGLTECHFATGCFPEEGVITVAGILRVAKQEGRRRLLISDLSGVNS